MKPRPNRILGKPATLADARSDRGTPGERQIRAAQSREQLGQAQTDGNAAGSNWRGRRTQ